MKKLANSLLLLLLYNYLLIFSTRTSTAKADDGAVLLQLAKSITPLLDTWSNSSSANFCHEWHGVKCDSSGRVTSLSIDNRRLSGSLPSNLSSLSHLTYLSFSYNNFSGKLPSFANLSNLRCLILEMNKFTSVPPDFLLGLLNLTGLRMSGNPNLAPWHLPLHLSESKNLEFIEASETNLVGSFPDIFGSFPHLWILDLSYNNLTGTLPLSLQECTISELLLNNQEFGLTGSINVLTRMTNLSRVLLNNNKLQGPIPDLSDLGYLQILLLDENEFTGLVPESLISLPDLSEVTLSNNKLQGPIPTFPDIYRMIDTDVSNGTNNFCAPSGESCDEQVTTLLQIAGSVEYPEILSDVWQGNDACHHWEFIGCDDALRRNVISVNLSGRGFAGTISPAFGNLTRLNYLYLNNNNLTGPIPDELTNLEFLKVLDVSNNNLSGEVPKFSGSVNLITAPGNSLLRLRNKTNRPAGIHQNKTNRPAGIHQNKTNRPAVVILLVVGATIASAILISILIARGLRAKDKRDIEPGIKMYHAGQIPKRYSYADIKKITKSFVEKLGQGGSGAVYKGELESGISVAVKVLNKSRMKGEEFNNEVASIGSTCHVNIVSLLGFCYHRRAEKAALIYEYMPNGSLDGFIYGSGAEQPNFLGWKRLYDIAIGIARGLEYLHRGCTTRIVHFDIKPHNILLDQDFCPKISDFGLAKHCRSKESKVSMMDGTRGTAGYIAPEVVCRNLGGVTCKADVYSYGMMVLEMVGGRKNVDVGASNSSKIFFPEWISNHFEVLLQEEICSTTSYGVLTSSADDEEMAKKMVFVGLWCVQTCPSNRPSMTKVVEMLEGSSDFKSLHVPPNPFTSTFPDHQRSPHEHKSISIALSS